MDISIRKAEIEEIKSFIQEPGSGLVYIRGRRRVGKSWILSALSKQEKHVFYFVGSKDANDELHRKRFAEKWEEFSGDSFLSDLSLDKRSWNKIFKHISVYAASVDFNLTLIFDEIQWIAKKGLGFVGLIKEFWLEWEQAKNIKIIICGSSNRFFSQTSGGEEKILRGLKTRSSIWIEPFSPAAVKKYYFPKCLPQERILIYMLFGGIPYYLNQLDMQRGFIQAINKACFTQEGIFLEEMEQILDLEFNAQGMLSAERVLSCLGQSGSNIKNIALKTGFDEAAVFQIINKLLKYKLVYEKVSFGSKKKNRSGSKFYMKDFFLNFYFQILQKLAAEIKRNKKGLLFPAECLSNANSYYIPDFSGQAFELFIRTLLEEYPDFNNPVFQDLMLSDYSYQIETYWDANSQIDLLVYHPNDLIERAIEVRWLSRMPRNKSEFLPVINRLNSYQAEVGREVKKYFFTSLTLPESVLKEFKENDIKVLNICSIF